MPARLKSLELQGYKTFASRTLFEFADSVTAIVGPNGSGKSNIADSLRWVLGEQSYSLLRGKKTEDMIFAGSQHRPRAGMAAATVTFDNSDGWLPIDFTEVSVARRAYRDGQNEYLINGQRVRLKDVSELLAQSGLAERTYTIIGQGVVDAALALKAEERRRLFEEAAGIGLHRSRREEALRRLETTRRNLDRVQDILAELRPRLRSLERQARRAQEYEQVRVDLQVLLREWYGYHWHRAQRELTSAREHARRREATLQAARQTQEKFDERLAQAREQIHALRARLNSWHRQLSQLHARRESLSRQLAVADERQRANNAQDASLQAELSRLDEEAALHADRQAASAEELARLEAEWREAQEQAQAARQALTERQSDRQAAEQALQAARQHLGEMTARQGQLQARLAERRSQVERRQAEVAQADENLSQAEAARLAAQSALQTAAASLEQAGSEYQVALEARQAHQARLAKLDAERQSARAQRAEAAAELARLQAQWEVLEQAEAALTGYAAGTQVLLKAARRQALPGAEGAFSAQLEVPAELESAIAASLGEYLDAVILENGSPDPALDLLGEAAARGALLPLASLAPPEPAPGLQQAVQSGEAQGVLGIASELVNAPPVLRPAVDLLLGNTLVVRDRNAAQRALARWGVAGAAGGSLRAVTLQGEVFHARGPVLAGGVSKDGAAQTTLGRSRQRRELATVRTAAETGAKQAETAWREAETRWQAAQAGNEGYDQAVQQAQAGLENARTTHGRAEAAAAQADQGHRWQAENRARLQAEIERAGREATQLQSELDQLSVTLEEAQHELRASQTGLAELPLEDYQAQLAHWSALTSAAERALQSGRQRNEEISLLAARTARAREEVQARLAALTENAGQLAETKATQRQEEIELAAEIEALQSQIDPAEGELEAAEATQDRIQHEETTSRQALSQAEHHHAQARIHLARNQEALETWRRRIEDDFGLVAFSYAEEISGPTPLPLAGMVEQLPVVTNLSPELEEGVRRQRAQLRRMGAINPEAQKEYQEVKERYEFMTSQVADLEKAEADIRQVIAELDELMERELRRTFEAVAGEFGEIFKRLFGGGSARLILTDPDDMTQTGIDIEARLPGRRTQGLSLLSGGERSLTATSLVFALLRVSPTPFCVLDEVDAMLDEANVGRFRELLRELGQKTQFIVVTHNRNTVQVADVIYGVTMGRDTASQVISLKLDEIEKVISR